MPCKPCIYSNATQIWLQIHCMIFTILSLKLLSAWLTVGLANFPETERIATRLQPNRQEWSRPYVSARIITPLESSPTLPIVLAASKDGSSRFCVDFRNLNDILKRDRWPLLRADEIFEKVRGSIVFTTLELFKDIGRSRWMIRAKKISISYAGTACFSLNSCYSNWRIQEQHSGGWWITYWRI